MQQLTTWLRFVLLAPALLVASSALAQKHTPIPLQVTGADLSAQAIGDGSALGGQGVNGRPFATQGAARFDLASLTKGVRSLISTGGLGGMNPALSGPTPPIPAPGFYGTDIHNYQATPFYGPTILSAQHHAVYVNEPDGTTWGDPETFLTDLGESHFIHLVDQYVGLTAPNRYTVGTSYSASYAVTPGVPLQTSDIWAIVHAAAQASGESGYNHIYHVFLPPGVDVCYPRGCYSPDDPANFIFCGLHQSITFTDSVGHVVYTLQPYQDVSGCQAPPTGTPNGQLADSTYDDLSHEVFEAITDPDVNAWKNGATGDEMADLCVLYATWPDGNTYSANPTSKLNGHWYRIQAEYSNRVHACVNASATDR